MASPNTPLLPSADALVSSSQDNRSNTRRQSFIRPDILWRCGAVLSTVGIIAGAFGSHGLKSRATLEQLDAFKIASNYAIFNGIALLVISSHPRFGYHAFAGPAILAGASIFSGSIMALVLNRDRFKFLGPITPIGGSIMIAGYIALAL